MPVPAQDRGWCDQESAAATSGKQSGEGGDHGAVSPVDPRTGCASLQHGQLMAQDENLISWRVGAGVERHQLGGFVNTGRSASPPPADHAAPPSGAKHQVSGSARCYGTHTTAATAKPASTTTCTSSACGPWSSHARADPARPAKPTNDRRAFRRTVKWRTGSEARISTLKRRLRMGPHTPG